MNLEKYMIPCLSKTLFGIECLGCGFQRSLLLFLKGDFKGSFYMFPALIPSLLFLLFIGLHLINNRLFSQKNIFVLGIINVIFMIAGYVYKHY
tara:strand:+ start:6336 stop:6614 length:279 start_codon:yes stop_codon:yes gene_type:complete